MDQMIDHNAGILTSDVIATDVR